jgi:hypothetical protein
LLNAAPIFRSTGIDELMDSALADDSDFFKAMAPLEAKHIMRFSLRGTKEDQGICDLSSETFMYAEI